MSSVEFNDDWFNTSDTPKSNAPKRRILCATDLGFRSERAVQRAALLAKSMHAHVLFVHVVNNWQPERLLRLKANRARARLMTQVDKVMSHSPESANVEIHIGAPLAVISELAQEWNADLIVLAAPVTRRYERLLGTTAERIIRSVNCPVLIVNRVAANPYERVVVATDLSPTSARVAQAIVQMDVLKETYAWFVHAVPLKANSLMGDTHCDFSEISPMARWQKLATAELATQIEHAGLDVASARISAELSPPIETIERIIDEADPELLVIGTSRWFALKRMLARSVAHQLLKNVSCDILAVSAASVEREERRSPGDEARIPRTIDTTSLQPG